MKNKILATVLVTSSILFSYSNNANAIGTVSSRGASTTSSSSSSSMSSASRSNMSMNSTMNSTRTSSTMNSSSYSNAYSGYRYNPYSTSSYQSTMPYMYTNNFLFYYIIFSSMNQREQMQYYERMAKSQHKPVHTITVETSKGDKTFPVTKEQYNKIKEGQSVTIKNNKVSIE